MSLGIQSPPGEGEWVRGREVEVEGCTSAINHPSMAFQPFEMSVQFELNMSHSRQCYVKRYSISCYGHSLQLWSFIMVK